MLPFFDNGRFPLFLAPMALFTDAVFRRICRECGADVLVTEFVRADSIVRDIPEAWEGVDFDEPQRPVGVQIYGSEPEVMAGAALRIVERYRPDFIDLNFGCPADKIVNCNAGSSMLLDLPRLSQVVSAVVKAVSPTPVTAKIRIGWDSQNIVALEAGLRIEDAGAQMLTIHGRTRAQGYSGEPDWEVIGSVASRLRIPVIGNGNLRVGEDVRVARAQRHIAGAMIGRAALGYPWVFREVRHYLKTGEMLLPPTLGERWDMIIRFAELTMERPFRQARHDDIQWMRPKLVKLTNGIPGSRTVRPKLAAVVTLEDLRRIKEEHLQDWDADKYGREPVKPWSAYAGFVPDQRPDSDSP